MIGAWSFVCAPVFGAPAAPAFMTGTCLKASVLFWRFLTDNYFSSLRAILKCIIYISQWYSCCGSSYYCCSYLLSVFLYPYCLSTLLFLCKGTMSNKCQCIWHQEKEEGGTHWHMSSCMISVCLQHQCHGVSEPMECLNCKDPPPENPPLIVICKL